MMNRLSSLKQVAGAVVMGMVAALGINGPAAAADAKPDFTGLWFPAGATQTPKQLPFTDYAQKKYDDYVAQFEIDDDAGYYCISPGMPRSIWGAPFTVEIFHRPQDVTIIWEGYNQYRKIYVDGYPRPEPLIATQMGFSVAHWEGDVLVVETDNLREYPYMIRTPTSEGARITERMHIETRDYRGTPTKFLVDELTLVDPKIYREPVKITASLRYSPETPILEYTCTDLLWEQYLERRGLPTPTLSD
ncbi:MAG: hypothetical protein H6978_04775 [Gammaproteobacteria bacterium]|nr:hypothetical protein [Gammaproteobacteria bacterium]